MLSIDRNLLEDACIDADVNPFTDDEYEFLRQYHDVIDKVALALKGLEADRNLFGAYLPTLIGLRHVLVENSSMDNANDTELCVPLAKAMLEGFERRFSSVMDPFNPESHPLYIAMISNPEYKLNFMGTSRIEPRVMVKLKEILLDAAMSILTEKVEEIQADKQNEHEG